MCIYIKNSNFKEHNIYHTFLCERHKPAQKRKMKPNNSLEAAFARPKLAVHDYSHTIFKLKPKIRIIHIVEPEIIKTTVEDFQELVQRLTGKPVERGRSRDKAGNKTKAVVSKTETAAVAAVLQETPRMKIEVEEIYDAENQTNFSSFLEEVDGFFHDMNEFPLLSFRSSHFNIFGELPLC